MGAKIKVRDTFVYFDRITTPQVVIDKMYEVSADDVTPEFSEALSVGQVVFGISR